MEKRYFFIFSFIKNLTVIIIIVITTYEDEVIMKVAVTSQGKSLDDQVDPRFGRCAYFVIVETETMQFEAIDNQNVMLGGGAGIQSAQLMSEHDVHVILTGNCGPNAFQTLAAAGIELIVGVSGTVREAVEQFKTGAFSSTGAPNVASHFGVGAGASPPSGDGAQFPEQQTGMGQGFGTGRGMGTGMGRGTGRGMGRGIGRGMGTGQGVYPTGPQSAQGQAGLQGQEGSTSSKQSLDALKAQAQAMEQQLQELNETIGRIESGAVPHRLVAVVKEEKCDACGLCVPVCPEAAIRIDTIAIINDSRCTGCGNCVAECPQDAITLKKA